MKKALSLLLTVIMTVALTACGAETPSALETPGASETPKATATPGASATPGAAATATPEVTPKPTPTPIAVPDEPVKTSPVANREDFNVSGGFLKGEFVVDGMVRYRIYVPNDYTEDKAYPMIMYFCEHSGLGTDNKSQLDGIELLFQDPQSPAFDCIVVAPQVPDSWFDFYDVPCGKLFDYVTQRYNIDSQRRYVIGIENGCFTAWKMVLEFPNMVSAYVNIHGPGPTFYVDGSGNSVDAIMALIDPVPEAAKDIPMYFFLGKDVPGQMSYYGSWIEYALPEIGGFTNVTVEEITGYAEDTEKHWASKTDTHVIDWLFAQKRQTK